MLYDFHKSQNEKKAGSLYATYLVYGIKNAQHARGEKDGDIEMAESSQDSDSAAEVVPTHTVTLIQEEQLHGKSVLSHVTKGTSLNPNSGSGRVQRGHVDTCL